MPDLNQDLKRKITNKTDTIISVCGLLLWFSAIIVGGLMERFDGWAGFAIALTAGAVYAACIVIIERRIRYWVRFSYHAGGIASIAIAYKQHPDALRELADIIEKENQ